MHAQEQEQNQTKYIPKVMQTMYMRYNDYNKKY